jgi:hypothetical protein
MMLSSKSWRENIMKIKSLFCTVWLLFSVSIASADISEGLVAYYPFDGDARDASGNGFHGTVHGATLTTDHCNVDNGAYQFDGVDDYIFFGPVLPDMNEMTVTMWVYSEEEETSTDMMDISVLFADGDWQDDKVISLTTNSDNWITIRGTKNDKPMIWGVNAYNPLHLTWRHIVWSTTGVESTLYIDGERVNGFDCNVSSHREHNLVLGTVASSGRLGDANGFWKGKVSNLRIYNRALSSAEAGQLYSHDPRARHVGIDGDAGRASLSQGLVVDCPFDGNTKDASGNNRHGTVHGATLTRDQNGRENSAYEFDGVNDYIHFGNVLPDMMDMTVSMWVRCEQGSAGTSIFVDGDWVPGNDCLLGVDSANRVILVSNKNDARLDERVAVTPQLSGAWRHVVWVLTDVWTSVYIDGVECRALERGGPNLGYHNLILGAQESTQGRIGEQSCWKGAISALRVYDRVLSDAEIVALYEQDRPLDLTLGLVAYYPFDGNAEDQSGHGRHGTVMGATLTADQHGVENSAYEFDGVDDCIYFGPVLPDMDKMTVCIWVYAPYSTEDRNHKVFFCDSDWTPGNDVTLMFRRWGGSVNRFQIRANKNGYKLWEEFELPGNVSNRWVQLVWVMTESYSSLYGDGREFVTVLKGGSNRGNHNLILGTQESSQGMFGGGGWWKGKISSLRVYDRVLSKREISALYEQDAPGCDTVDLARGLVAYYPMNEGSGQTVVDVSGSGHDGTIYGVTNIRQTLNDICWVNSLAGLGKALNFPGTWPQHVDTGTWNPSQGTNQLSIAFWMRWNGYNGEYQNLMAKASGWDAASIYWQIAPSREDGGLSIASPGHWFGGGGPAPVGQWQHAIFTFDGLTTTIYYDGVHVANGTNFAFGDGMNAPVVIGAGVQGGGCPFNGALDELRIYNRALTPAEVWYLTKLVGDP